MDLGFAFLRVSVGKAFLWLCRLLAPLAESSRHYPPCQDLLPQQLEHGVRQHLHELRNKGMKLTYGGLAMKRNI